MAEITYLPGAQPVHVANTDATKAVHANVVKHLQDLLGQAQRGEIVGIVTVRADDQGSVAYGLIGAIGGFQMQGGLSCATAHVAAINIGDAEDSDE